MRAQKMRRPLSMPARQEGVVIFIALIALVIMSMVGISMVRQMSSGQQIIGNLAFKQAATALTDQATEQVLSDLLKPEITSLKLDQNAAINGYLSEAQGFKNDGTFVTCTDQNKPECFDPANEATWTGRVGPSPDNSYPRITYVVHRLCFPKKVMTDPNEARRCIGRETSEGTEKTSDPAMIPPKQIQPYYRVMTLVEGDRNSRSITQTMIY